MTKISMEKLALLVKNKRNELKMKQEELGKMTNINRLLIGKIERKEFVPSISQLESLANALRFSITELFETEAKQNVFTAMRGQAATPSEEEGLDKLFSMMLFLKQQRVLRSKLANE